MSPVGRLYLVHIYILENLTEALFRYENFLNFATVALSFVCSKYCPIIE